MKHVTSAALMCLVASFWLETATAQPPLPNTQPTVSPYVNLRRGGASAAVNYFGLVRPALQFRSALTDLQQQSANNQTNTAQAADPQTGLPYTGHTAVFLNTGGYFLSNLGGTGGQRATGTPGQRTTGVGQMAQSQPGQPSGGASGRRR